MFEVKAKAGQNKIANTFNNTTTKWKIEKGVWKNEQSKVLKESSDDSETIGKDIENENENKIANVLISKQSELKLKNSELQN